MTDHLLFSIFVFLAASCLVVPLMGRLGLGSVLGYLACGILIGPFGFGLIVGSEEVRHFAEFGVVMMLFMIGLELEPETLWRLRKPIIGLGSLQVAGTSLLFTSLGAWLGYDWRVALACGMALSLSSTAIGLQLMEERGLLPSAAGQASFSVLLFQDIAVIAILIALPLLAQTLPGAEAIGATHGSPPLQRLLLILCVIAAIVLGGRYLAHHIFRYIARANLREIFTAISLLLVVGTTLIMQAVGLSPALGAFLAGVVLANSEYKHTLESDIQPFKGLLLGLFFISIGMGMDFALLAEKPSAMVAAVALLVSLKMGVLALLGRFFSLSGPQNIVFVFLLAQGGEFAFVLFQYAAGLTLLNEPQLAFLTLTVALSMAITPLLMLVNDRFVVPRFFTLLPSDRYDHIEDRETPVIIAGYGRVGQIVGRFLMAQGVKVTILEKDPDQIAILRRFGTKGYYGDASRLDLLRNAGAEKAKLLIIAIDDTEKAVELAAQAKKYFPNLRTLARARNRRHAYELQKAGADIFVRETFDSSLRMAQEAMRLLGHPAEDIAAKAVRFRAHDEATLTTSFAFFDQESELITFTRQRNEELERVLREDTVSNNTLS